MIIISAGMQKSGSAYFYNIINELNQQAGNPDAREIKKKYDLDRLMMWHNNNIGRPTLFKLMKLWKISEKEGDFVVKTHHGPNLTTRILSRVGVMRTVYCYRDPRDVLLSAIDHGKKIAAQGETHTFAKMIDFDKAMVNVKKWLRIWRKYSKAHGVLTVKYEEMMEAPMETAKSIGEFLGMAIPDKKMKDILWQYSKDNHKGDRTGMHLNKARAYRYKMDMPEPQKKKIQEALGSYIRDMGYEVDA